MKERGPSTSSLFLGKTQPNQVRPFAAALRREGLVGVAVFFRGLLKIEKKQNKKTEKSAPLRQRRSGFSPTPLLALATSRHLNRQWSVADLIPTPPVFQRRKRGREANYGGPFRAKEESRSGPRGASKAAAAEVVAGLWAENPLGHPWPSPQCIPHLPPSPAPGSTRQIFFPVLSFFLFSSSFFCLFRFLPARPGILCQEDSALSLLRPCPPLGCAPSQFRWPALASFSLPPSSALSLPSLSPYASRLPEPLRETARESGGALSLLTFGPLVWPERRTPGCRTGRSRPQRRRSAR